MHSVASHRPEGMTRAVAYPRCGFERSEYRATCSSRAVRLAFHWSGIGERMRPATFFLCQSSGVCKSLLDPTYGVSLSMVTPRGGALWDAVRREQDTGGQAEECLRHS